MQYSDETMASSKRFIRPKRGRIVGGVSLAIANYLGIDVVWVRIVWILLLLPGGLPGLLPYLILWLIIPSES